MVASFQDCIINGSESGATALNVRLLQANGYKVQTSLFSLQVSTALKVILVRHDMLQPDMTVVAR